VHVNVPLHFVDEELSPGLKRGGVLSIVRHEIELIVDAAHIPDQIVVSMNGFDVGESVHISSVTLPTGAKLAIEDRDFTVATITAPSALKSAEGAATDEAEGSTEA
jgi:large subunit ribosomal protein L25